MGIFSSLFKKRNAEEEQEEALHSKINAQWEEEQVEEEPEIPEVIKEQAAAVSQLILQPAPVSYENFLENNMLLKVPVVCQFTETIRRHQSCKLPEDIKAQQVVGLCDQAEEMTRQLEELKATVQVFRQKDEKLRKQILDYTQVVKQVNEKKLQKEEFERIKQVLEPQIQKVNKSRELFLKEEKEINEKLQAFNQEMLRTCKACQEVAKKIKENN